MILTDTYILTGMMHSATLALDDITGLCKLATENLNAKTFAF